MLESIPVIKMLMYGYKREIKSNPFNCNKYTLEKILMIPKIGTSCVIIMILIYKNSRNSCLIF